MKKKIIIVTLSIAIIVVGIGAYKIKTYSDDFIWRDCKKIYGYKNLKYSDFYKSDRVRDRIVQQVFKENESTKDLMNKYSDTYGILQVEKSIQDFTDKVITKSEAYKNGYIGEDNEYVDIKFLDSELEKFLQEYFSDKKALEDIKK